MDGWMDGLDFPSPSCGWADMRSEDPFKRRELLITLFLGAINRGEAED